MLRNQSRRGSSVLLSELVSESNFNSPAVCLPGVCLWPMVWLVWPAGLHWPRGVVVLLESGNSSSARFVATPDMYGPQLFIVLRLLVRLVTSLSLL